VKEKIEKIIKDEKWLASEQAKEDVGINIDVIKIINKIIDRSEGKKYLNESLEIVKSLIVDDERKYFYLESIDSGRNDWEKGEICKLLHKIYKVGDDEL
jgi:hypothetical protein